MKDRRAHFRINLNELYLPYYDALCGILSPEWQPYSGFRSELEQYQLFNKGRSESGLIVTNARPFESAHNYGCATDWIIFDEDGIPDWIKDDDPQWKEYSDAIKKVGGSWGGDWIGFKDIDHNELPIDVSWKRNVYPVYKTGGLDAAYNFLKEHLKK